MSAKNEVRILQDVTLVAYRDLWKRVPTETRWGGITGTGFTSVREGKEKLTYEVWVDIEGLPEIARKAARNKNGHSKDGALHVRLISRHQEMFTKQAPAQEAL